LDKPTIGIRIANGTFFPILQENDRKKKRVILTPVKETQKDVKIDLFRGDGEGMLDPVYVASLILNNIDQSPEKQAEIQLIVNVSDDRVLDAEAFEPVSGVKQFLSISLSSIEENADFYNISESDSEENSFSTDFSAQFDEEMFETEEEEALSDDLSEEEESFSDSQFDEGTEDEDSEIDESVGEEEAAPWLYERDNKCERKTRLLKAAVVILGIIFLLLLFMLLYTLFLKPTLAKEQVSPPPAVVATVEETAPPPPQAAPVPEKTEVVEEPEVKPEPAPVQVSEPVKKVEDIRYRIKWGDTLWDLSNTYYRTPWRYKKIAADNRIKNPDLIYAGSYLTIKGE
jgi:hypothetical protein